MLIYEEFFCFYFTESLAKESTLTTTESTLVESTESVFLVSPQDNKAKLTQIIGTNNFFI